MQATIQNNVQKLDTETEEEFAELKALVAKSMWTDLQVVKGVTGYLAGRIIHKCKRVGYGKTRLEAVEDLIVREVKAELSRS